jgi:2-dehydropantoate 2-reductase
VTDSAAQRKDGVGGINKLSCRIVFARGAGMRHGVLGVGAIGGLMSTVLASLGEDVTVVVRAEKLASYPKNLTLERPSGSLTAAVNVAVALTAPVDVLWIATKTYQLDAALEAVKAVPSYVIPLLNGVEHVAGLRARFGDGRVVPATIAVEAERAFPGRFIQRSSFVRLNFAADGEPLLGSLAARLRELGFSCEFIANEQTLLWGKLCFLGPLALTTTASEMNIGEIFADATWKQKLISAIDEASAVANASGAAVDARQIRSVAEGLPPGMRSSMQKDLAAGRQLELDGIGGPIVRGGERYGIDVSTTDGLMSAICKKSLPAGA